MAQTTLVWKLTAHEGRSLEQRLAQGSFDFRSVPHAIFSAKGEGVVVTLYTSGKLVVQGQEPETFALRHLPDHQPSPTPKAPASAAATELAAVSALPTVGSDETGKGDFLGPLVVVALRLEVADSLALSGSGVTDSKLLSDQRARELGAALSGRFEHGIACIDPCEYNAQHAQLGNLNILLARAHARAIREIARPGDRVVIDRFGPQTLLARELEGLDCVVEQFPRAESQVPAVAAASIVARMLFLEALEQLSQRFAVDLAKGAGAPADSAARAFVKLHGRDQLGQVAKLHFKNTGRI